MLIMYIVFEMEKLHISSGNLPISYTNEQIISSGKIPHSPKSLDGVECM